MGRLTSLQTAGNAKAIQQQSLEVRGCCLMGESAEYVFNYLRAVW
jgi:hypothetical protein